MTTPICDGTLLMTPFTAAAAAPAAGNHVLLVLVLMLVLVLQEVTAEPPLQMLLNRLPDTSLAPITVGLLDADLNTPRALASNMMSMCDIRGTQLLLSSCLRSSKVTDVTLHN